MVESSEELTAMANREGYALELKDFDWTSVDISVATQEQVNAFQDPLKEYIETKTKVELFDEALKRDILLIPITNMKDVDESPQLAYREFWNKVYHDELDDNIKYTGWPVKWTEMPPYKPQRRAPLIGEHNHSIYEKELGLSLEQIILLKNQGVV